MLNKNFIKLISFFTPFFFPVVAFARDRVVCSGISCLEPIYLESYNTNLAFGEFFQVLGMFMGLVLFSIGFYCIGLFLYKR